MFLNEISCLQENETDPSSLIFLSTKDVYDLICKPKQFLEMLIESCYSYPDFGDKGWCNLLTMEIEILDNYNSRELVQIFPR